MTIPVDVPDVPGVPALNFAPGAALGIELLDSDALIGFLGLGPQWGIFLDGAPIVVADSVIDFSLKKEWAISDYPVEQGGFGSYDKVYIPFDARVRFSAGGSIANRQALLDSIDAIAGDLNIYDVVCPETVYPSCNIVHYDFRRTAQNGVGLIVVDVWLLQVVVISGSGAFTSTQAPSGASQVNGGTVQTTAPTAAQSSAGADAAVGSASPNTLSMGGAGSGLDPDTQAALDAYNARHPPGSY